MKTGALLILVAALLVNGCSVPLWGNPDAGTAPILADTPGETIVGEGFPTEKAPAEEHIADEAPAEATVAEELPAGGSPPEEVPTADSWATDKPSEAPLPAPASEPETAPPELPASRVGLPKRLRIPAVQVEAGFEYVGLTPEGAMGAPEDPDRVAWYRAGPRPGQPGNAAIAGHVDWAGKVRAFWWLKQLEVGDIVEVVTEGDESYRFVVRWLRWYDAADAPIEEIFGSSQTPEITLITCGGLFDRRAKQYLSRLVVRAALE
ncbi:MAG: class F sortase [Chloroflexota bacterium]